MRELTRITTEYSEDEDRVRLSGETPQGETVVLWLPQRLLNRLVPALCNKLEPDADMDRRAEALNAFEQMAAVQSLAPLPVVQAAPQSQSYTIRAVTIVSGARALQLLLKERDAPETQETSLTVQHAELRQWLAIVYGQYVKAGWPLDLWPSWIRDQRAPAPGADLVLH